MPKPSNKRPPIICIRGLNFYYKETQALNNIDLDITQNRITALIGPSGCGKSTFLRCFNRMNDLILDTRVTGSILYDGQEINAKNVDIISLRQQIGMVFQKSNPFPKSIYENVIFGLRIMGIKNKTILSEAVENSLQRAGLFDEVKDRLQESALSLSGGQMQRLCIARTIAVNPKIILMDEPCSALDPRSTARIESLMTELRKKYTIIIVTHNMQQASRISDNTAFFYEGKLIEYGRTKNIFTNPTQKSTEDYITGRFG